MTYSFSNYKLQLPDTGTEAGNWGTIVNTNMGSTSSTYQGIEQAIGGSSTVNFTGTTEALSYTDTTGNQNFRALYLNCTGTPGGAATLTVPAIQKMYIVKNGTTGGFDITVKIGVSTGTVVPNGKTMILYANGTDVITTSDYFSGSLQIAGSVGIGTTPTSGYQILSGGTYPTSGGFSFPITTAGTIPSGTTTAAQIFRATPSTAAASFTLPFLNYFYASQGTIGAGSAVTNQYGYTVDSSLTGATNNYGFFGNIASGSGRWNFYANGTASNFFAGRVFCGDGTDTGAGIFVNYNISGLGGFGYGIKQNNSVQSSVTSEYTQYQSISYTQATAFTLGNYKHFGASQGSIGAGSTVTNQYGFIVESSLTGATANYGFYSNIASGTGRYNFYANGTADNYFGGNVQIVGALGAGGANYGTSGQVLVSQGSGSAPQWGTVLTQGTSQSTTSGTAFTFTGIPSTVKRITFMLANVGTAGAADLLIRLGTGGSVVSTGYTSCACDNASNKSTNTTGFLLTRGPAAAANRENGTVTICSMGSNLWVYSSVLTDAANTSGYTGGGYITLAGALDRIQITLTASTFAAGTVNILYE